MATVKRFSIPVGLFLALAGLTVFFLVPRATEPVEAEPVVSVSAEPVETAVFYECCSDGAPFEASQRSAGRDWDDVAKQCVNTTLYACQAVCIKLNATDTDQEGEPPGCTGHPVDECDNWDDTFFQKCYNWWRVTYLPTGEQQDAGMYPPGGVRGNNLIQFAPLWPGEYQVWSISADYDFVDPDDPTPPAGPGGCEDGYIINTEIVTVGCPEMDGIELDENKIKLCESTIARLKPNPCLPLKWDTRPRGLLHFSLLKPGPVQRNGETVDEHRVTVTPNAKKILELYPDQETVDIPIVAEVEGFEEECYRETTLTVELGCSTCAAAGGSGGPAPAGTGKVQLGSVDVQLSMGMGADGESAGALMYRAAGPVAAASSNLGYNISAARTDIEVYYDTNGDLLQVLSPEALADVVTTNGYDFKVDFYLYANRGSQDPETGIYSPVGSPFASWRFHNPNGPANYDQLDVVRTVNGSLAATYQFTYSTAGSIRTWTLVTLDSGGAEERREEDSWNTTTSVRDYVVKDSGGQVVHAVREQHDTKTFTHPFNATLTYDLDVITSRTVDPGGLDLTTTWTYYETEAGKSGSVKSIRYPDDSWVWYNYDTQGRMITAMVPWLDGAYGDPPSAATSVTTTYGYTPWGPSGLLYDSRNLERPRTITESVDSVVVSKTYYAYQCDGQNDPFCMDWTAVDVVERAANNTAAFGHADNLRTTTRYKPAEGTDKIDKITYPDDQWDVYTYEDDGTYAFSTTDPQFSTSPGTDDRVQIVHGSTTNPTGDFLRSTIDMVVTDDLGRTVLNETYMTDEYTRLSWTAQENDAQGRVTDVYRSNGTHSENTWGCCSQSSTTDESGVKTDYQTDALGRVWQETKKGASGSYPAQVDIDTTRAFDVMHRVLTTTVSETGGLSLSSSRTYDAAGRVLTETDEADIETTYGYEHVAGTGLKVTVTRPNGATEITQYRLDGRIKSRIGTGVIHEYHSHGTNTDGTQWTKVNVGSAGSPRYTKTTTDVLGRTIEVERPGYDAGSTVTTGHEYDKGGGVTKTTNTTMIPGSDDGGDGDGEDGGGGGEGGDPTFGGTADRLFVYDDLGNLTSQGLDINDNGTLDDASVDRITYSDSLFDWDGSNWWRESTSEVLATDNSATRTLTSTQRTQLTGLGTGTGNVLTGVSESEDIHGNKAASRTYVDRANKLVTRETDLPDSTTDASSASYNGLLQESTSGSGLTVDYGYDALGRQTHVTGPRTAPNSTVTAYNTLGQVSSVTDPAGNAVSYTYDEEIGELTAVTNAAGKKTYTEYDLLGRVKRVWGDVPQPVEIGYDATYGQRTTLNTYRGGTGWEGTGWPASPGTADTTTWAYHAATGLVTSKTYADGKATTYTYTTGGGLKTRLWARSGSLITTYAYDEDTGELLTIDRPVGTSDVTMWYNRLGRLKQVNDAVGLNRTFAYDAALQFANETMTGLINKRITRSYEAAQAGAKGRPTILEVGTAADPDADYQSGYFYDGFGRLNRVAGPGLPAHGAVYSRVTNSELLAGHTFNTDASTVVGQVIRSYEANRDLITSIENKWGGSQVSKYSYINDNLGRRTSILRTGPAFATNPHFDLSGYNDRSELTGSTRYNAGDPTDPQPGDLEPASDHGFVYDNIGNRESYTPGTASPTTYTANQLNQYTATATPAETFTHDFDGNLTGDADYTYIWNGENRLTTVTPKAPVSVGDKQLVFHYDYLGRRFRKLVYTWQGDPLSWELTAKRLFIYDGWNLLLELDAMDSSNVDSKYTWGMDLSGTLHGAGGIGGLLATHDVDSSTDYVYFHDANGNIGQLVDISDGSVDAKYEYDPYGGDTSATGSFAPTNPLRFSTKYLDAEVAFTNGAHGLYYYGYRYYSPRLGRWLSRDPIEEQAGANLSSFVMNDPARVVDPDGRIPFLVSGLAGGSGIKPKPKPQPVPVPTPKPKPGGGAPSGSDCGIDIFQTPFCLFGNKGHTWLTWGGGDEGETADLPKNHIQEHKCQKNPKFINNKWNTVKKNGGELWSTKKACDQASCSDIKACLTDYMKAQDDAEKFGLFYHCRNFAGDAMSKCCLRKTELYYVDWRAPFRFCCSKCGKRKTFDRCADANASP